MREVRIPRGVLDFINSLPREYRDKKVSEIIEENISQTFVDESETCTTKPGKKKKNRAPPRPPNAFILYRRSKQQLVLDEHGEISNNEVSKMIGKMWHNEPIEERVRWHQLADQKKIEHIARYPDYKYQPRRPSDRIRRKKRMFIEAVTHEPDKQKTERMESEQKDLIEVDQPISEPVIESVTEPVIEQTADHGHSFCDDVNNIASLGAERMINDYLFQFLFANGYSPSVFQAPVDLCEDYETNGADCINYDCLQTL